MWYSPMASAVLCAAALDWLVMKCSRDSQVSPLLQAHAKLEVSSCKGALQHMKRRGDL